jgi:hypothetical protein
VALLEWSLSEVFDAADAPVITRAALAEVPPEAWDELRFEFHPSLRRLRLSWNTTAVWQAMTREESPPDPTPSEAPVEFVLWRLDLKNYFRSLQPAEFTALDAAVAGCSFGALCADLGRWLPDEEIPLTAANFLNTWVTGGLITALV